MLRESSVELTERDKNFSERYIRSWLYKALKDFKRDTLKQFFDIILLRCQWQNFKGWQLPNFFGSGFDSMSPWHNRSKAKNKTILNLSFFSLCFRYWIGSQTRYKTFLDTAAKKQSYHCAPHWQAYIHIATEELFNDISSMNSFAEFSSKASLQLAEHKTHKNK